VCVFDAEQRNILVRPGPRMPEAARLMADCAAKSVAAKKCPAGACWAMAGA
jgi:iron complex transport system substrate-binding protein